MHPFRTAVSPRPRSRPPISFRCEPLESRRLLAAGSLDPSFGVGGQAVADFGTPVVALDVAVQADGKTVAVGRSKDYDGFYVARFNVNGTPDTTFGPDHNGRIFEPFAPTSYASAVAVQSDGKIVVAGNHEFDVWVFRFNPNGSLDTTFDGDGKTNLGDSAAADRIAFQSDGKILLGGTTPTGIINITDQITVERLNPDGSLDGSFGDGGTATHDLETAGGLEAMAVDYTGTPATNPAYGKIVIAGYKDNDVLVMRLNTNGGVDNTFDGDGSATLAVPGSPDSTVAGVVIQGDGKIVVAGHTGAQYNESVAADYFLVRFLPTGPVDSGFGSAGTGWVRTDLGGIDLASDVISTLDGGLIVGGLSTRGSVGNPTTTDDAFAVYTRDGLPDTRFGGGTGKFHAGIGDDTALAYGPGHRFVAAGAAGGKMHVARFLDAGANLVNVASLDSVATEAGPTTAGFFVYRSERLPYPTDVYLSVSGSATSPLTHSTPLHPPADYTGVVDPPRNGTLSFDTAYVEIPANETFTTVTITPINDTRVEGNETAVFTVKDNADYDVGDPGSVTITIVDDDAPPPTVAQVYVRGSTWRGDDLDPGNTTFGEALAAGGYGDTTLGYRADNVAAGTTLPWINANQVILRYSSPPTGSGIPTAGGVTLHGMRSDYSVTSLDQLDPSTYVLTLDRALGNLPASAGGGNDGDRVTLTVPGGGPGGAAYSLALNVLQGDADRAGGRVNAVDLGFVKARLNRTSNDPPATGAQYTPFADANGDGRINAIDLGAVKARLNHAMPAALAATASPSPLKRLDEQSIATELLGGA